MVTRDTTRYQTYETITDEAFLSNDGNSLILYGKYIFGNGDTIPVKMTVKASDTLGRARMKFEFTNTLGSTVSFKTFQTVHMDLSGQHDKTRMKTLGGRRGIYFNETAKFGYNDLLDGLEYYVAFYTYNTIGANEPEEISVYSFGGKDLDTGKAAPTDSVSSTAAPNSWTIFNKTDKYVYSKLGKFDESQVKGDIITHRNLSTGAIINNDPIIHPGWSYVYPTQELKNGETSEAVLEFKVSDIEDVSYDPLVIHTTPYTAISKADFELFEPIYTQEMMKIQDPNYKAKDFEITIKNPEMVEINPSDFEVLH